MAVLVTATHVFGAAKKLVDGRAWRPAMTLWVGAAPWGIARQPDQEQAQVVQHPAVPV